MNSYYKTARVNVKSKNQSMYLYFFRQTGNCKTRGTYIIIYFI